MQWSDLAGRVPSAKSVARSDPIWNSAYKSLSMTPPVYPHLMPEPNCDDLTYVSYKSRVYSIDICVPIFSISVLHLSLDRDRQILVEIAKIEI